MNASAGISARAKKAKPFLLKDESQIDEMPPFPFPYMGDAADDVDAEKLCRLFVDKTGLGSPSEPALTHLQFIDTLRGLVKQNPEGVLLAISEEAPFQLYIEVWKNGGK